jgi:hypothetical protein
MRVLQRPIQPLYCLLLAVLLLLTSIPWHQTLNADDKPLVLSGFNGQGLSQTDPVLYGDATITLAGFFGGGVVGENLRIKIITDNGNTVQDLSTTAPTITGNEFTFTDISLKAGLNQISFYEKTGTLTKELLQFYVEYNNTPLVTDLTIDGYSLNSPSIDGTIDTVIPVPSIARLTLNLAGKAKNSEIIEVTNQRTGETIRTDVSRSGDFSLNLPTFLGENSLDIQVFNDNKRVNLINRTILVITTSEDGSDQLYNTTIQNLKLEPSKTPVLFDEGPTFTVNGSVLLSYIDTPDQQFDSFTLKIKNLSDSTIKTIPLPNDNGRFTTLSSTPDTCQNCKAAVYHDSYTGYRISADFTDDSTNPFFLDSTQYEVSLEYNYKTKNPVTNDLTIDNPTPVNYYSYRFEYADKTLPRFGDIYYKSSGKQVSLLNPNIAVTSPLTLQVQTYNMGDTTSAPDTTKLKVRYNHQLLASDEYGLQNSVALNSDMNLGQVDLVLKKLPTGQGKITVEYSDLADPTRNRQVSFTIDSQITPYVQISYQDSEQTRVLNSGHTIRDSQDIQTLTFKVYNYLLKNDQSNVAVSLNGTKLPLDSFNATNGTFNVLEAELEGKYVKGNNTLIVTLKDSPQVTFTYSISYFSAKIPSINDPKLMIEQNKKQTELTKAPAEISYYTGVSYLRSFEFSVTDAKRVYIEKNGKRVKVFKKDGDNWGSDTLDDEYEKARGETSPLQSYFDRNNFEITSSSTSVLNIKADMTSQDYGDLTEEVQDTVTSKLDRDTLLEKFPLTLRDSGPTVYTIVAEDEQGSIVRLDVNVVRESRSWEVLSPAKMSEKDPYIVVNSNTAAIRIFAENAESIQFGKTQAVSQNTTNPDFYYDDNLGRTIPKTYYVFETTVPLKPGLNTIKYTVVSGGNKYNDEVIIFHAASSINGAENRDILGKKVKFKVFDNGIELSFPKQTVLLSPSTNRAREEVRNAQSEIFVDVPLYFGIADRTTGQVNLPGSQMENRLILQTQFSYASPLYYIDAGDTEAPAGRDPYVNQSGNINGKIVEMNPFAERYHDNLVPSQRGELSISYDASIVNAANSDLTVFYHNGSEWLNLGGLVNTGKKHITVPFDGFGYYMVMKTRETFHDLVFHPFARDEMETMFSKGIMPNYSGSSFGANREITRGEFATILVKAMDLPINAGPYQDSNQRYPLEPTFNDVRPNRDSWDYQYKYIETATRAGIIKGSEPGYFRPDQPLTREQAAVMISRALNLKLPRTVEQAEKILSKLYTDGAIVDYYAAPSVVAVSSSSLMSGSPNDPSAKKPTYQFLPRGKLTRAEMAVVTKRVMVKLKKLPKS